MQKGQTLRDATQLYQLLSQKFADFQRIEVLAKITPCSGSLIWNMGDAQGMYCYKQVFLIKKLYL